MKGYRSIFEDAPVKDPRINHPPRLSDLRGDDLRMALIDRHHAARERHMATYTAPAPVKPEPLWKSVLAGLIVGGCILLLVLL